MERFLKFLTLISMGVFIKSVPLEKALTATLKEEAAKKYMPTLFAKIPQELDDDFRQNILSHTYIPKSLEAAGHSNQVAKVSGPVDIRFGTADWPPPKNVNFLNLPLFQRPHDNYNIIVATAPPNIKLGKADDLVVYVVFPDDYSSNGLTAATAPKILFVSDRNEKLSHKKINDEPISIVDSNRTVTNLRSKEILKFLKFHNKFTNQKNYV